MARTREERSEDHGHDEGRLREKGRIISKAKSFLLYLETEGPSLLVALPLCSAAKYRTAGGLLLGDSGGYSTNPMLLPGWLQPTGCNLSQVASSIIKRRRIRILVISWIMDHESWIMDYRITGITGKLLDSLTPYWPSLLTPPYCLCLRAVVMPINLLPMVSRYPVLHSFLFQSSSPQPASQQAPCDLFLLIGVPTPIPTTDQLDHSPTTTIVDSSTITSHRKLKPKRLSLRCTFKRTSTLCHLIFVQLVFLIPRFLFGFPLL